MKHFKEIFGRVMIEVTPTEAAMFGADIPVVNVDNCTWIEFEIWASKALSPNLAVRSCWISGCKTTVYVTIETFNEKSASTLKASGFTEYSVTSEEEIDDEGGLCGSCLVLNLPIVYCV